MNPSAAAFPESRFPGAEVAEARAPRGSRPFARRHCRCHHRRGRTRALFIKQELLADRANRKPAGDGFVYEGNDCRGFSGRPDGYSDWTCPPKRTAAGSCGPFLLAAIALKLPATSTARSWPARDAARSDADGRALETPVGDQPKAPAGGCRKCSKCRRGVTNEGRGPSCTFCTSCTSRR